MECLYPSPSAFDWIHVFSDMICNIVLTAQDSSGCSGTIQLSVMVNALPVISVSSTQLVILVWMEKHW